MRTENFNFHGLFHNSTNISFLKRLDLDAHTEQTLDDAVKKVKAALTPVLRGIAELAGVEANYRSPRYRLQGSKVYGTQNAPAHSPQQQVDIDLGTYLSATFLDTLAQQNGKKVAIPAKHIAKQYFDTVDMTLRILCKKEGWLYLDGQNKKDNCCRIDLSPKGLDAHIDVPLYAMPNVEFEKLEKAAMTYDSAEGIFEAAVRSDLAPVIDEDGWEMLDVVVMATRQGEWSESDVQKVITHFRDASKRISHPVILRRLWRYIKAWRDYNWRDGGAPSSILLMEAVVRILENDVVIAAELLASGRDDRTLLHLFKHLAFYLSDDVIVNWGAEPEPLNRGKAQERSVWVTKANQCAKILDQCFVDEELTQSQVIALVTQQFGKRIPVNTDFVKSTRKSAAALGLGLPQIQVSPQERVRSTQGA